MTHDGKRGPHGPPTLLWPSWADKSAPANDTADGTADDAASCRPSPGTRHPWVEGKTRRLWWTRRLLLLGGAAAPVRYPGSAARASPHSLCLRASRHK